MPRAESAGRPARSDLQIEEDPAFQSRVWKIERICWALMAALVIAALAGLAGGGALSHVERVSPDGTLSVEYERFHRYGAPASMTIRVAPQAGDGGRLGVLIGAPLMERFEIRGVVPEPQRWRAGPAGLRLDFAQEGPATIRLALMPRRAGALTAELGIVGGAALTTWQFVYP